MKNKEACCMGTCTTIVDFSVKLKYLALLRSEFRDMVHCVADISLILLIYGFPCLGRLSEILHALTWGEKGRFCINYADSGLQGPRTSSVFF